MTPPNASLGPTLLSTHCLNPGPRLASPYSPPIASTLAPTLPSTLASTLAPTLTTYSVQGRIAIPHRAAYAASKHALQVGEGM